MKEILLTEKRDGIPCVIIFPCSYTIHFTGDIDRIYRTIDNVHNTQYTESYSVDIQNTYNISGHTEYIQYHWRNIYNT